MDARRVWIDCAEGDGALSAVGVHLDADGRVFRVSAGFRIDAAANAARAVLGPAERLVDGVGAAYEATAASIGDAVAPVVAAAESTAAAASRARKDAAAAVDGASQQVADAKAAVEALPKTLQAKVSSAGAPKAAAAPKAPAAAPKVAAPKPAAAGYPPMFFLTCVLIFG